MASMYREAEHAKLASGTFAMELRREMVHCTSDKQRAQVAEMVGLAEGAAILLGRALSSYDEYISTDEYLKPL